MHHMSDLLISQENKTTMWSPHKDYKQCYKKVEIIIFCGETFVE